MYTEKLREALFIDFIISKLPFIYFTYCRLETFVFVNYDLILVLNLFSQDKRDLFIYMYLEVDKNIEWIFFRSYTLA